MEDEYSWIDRGALSPFPFPFPSKFFAANGTVLCKKAQFRRRALQTSPYGAYRLIR
ncbi:MAG: hypothetical protein BMS9Abin25_0471 [Gammaproteobacteria bacterium]|nr:MAG: hypothetical protein BMS9Abin25_0471 [Gammaproteobacteria bacterium]